MKLHNRYCHNVTYHSESLQCKSQWKSRGLQFPIWEASSIDVLKKPWQFLSLISHFRIQNLAPAKWNIRMKMKWKVLGHFTQTCSFQYQNFFRMPISNSYQTSTKVLEADFSNHSREIIIFFWKKWRRICRTKIWLFRYLERLYWHFYWIYVQRCCYVFKPKGAIPNVAGIISPPGSNRVNWTPKLCSPYPPDIGITAVTKHNFSQRFSNHGGSLDINKIVKKNLHHLDGFHFHWQLIQFYPPILYQLLHSFWDQLLFWTQLEIQVQLSQDWVVES